VPNQPALAAGLDGFLEINGESKKRFLMQFMTKQS
jgi:hypothetical protein